MWVPSDKMNIGSELIGAFLCVMVVYTDCSYSTSSHVALHWQGYVYGIDLVPGTGDD